MRKLSIDFPHYYRDNLEWFSSKFRVWRDTWDPIFVLALSSPVSTNLPLPADILRDYTLEFEIKVKSALVDLRECLREAVRDKDCCREIADTLMEDIEEISSVQESELVALREKLNRWGPAPSSTEAECA